MDFISIATVDAAHAEVIREALEGAGLPVQVVSVRPFRQLDHLRHQRRQLVDIEVPAAEATRGRALLELLEIEAQQAARAEAGDDEGEPARDNAGSGRAKPRRQLSSRFGLLLSLVFPVAGPIYAGARAIAWVSLASHLAGLLIYVMGANHRWYRDELHADLGLMVLAAARFLDVVATLQAIARHNGAARG